MDGKAALVDITNSDDRPACTKVSHEPTLLSQKHGPCYSQVKPYSVETTMTLHFGDLSEKLVQNILINIAINNLLILTQKVLILSVFRTFRRLNIVIKYTKIAPGRNYWH